MDMEEANNPASLLIFVCTQAFSLGQLVECAYSLFWLGSITCMEPYGMCFAVNNLVVLIWCKKLGIALIGMDVYLRSNLVRLNAMCSHQEPLPQACLLYMASFTNEGQG